MRDPCAGFDSCILLCLEVKVYMDSGPSPTDKRIGKKYAYVPAFIKNLSVF